jgi:hypothetical protein
MAGLRIFPYTLLMIYAHRYTFYAIQINFLVVYADNILDKSINAIKVNTEDLLQSSKQSICWSYHLNARQKSKDS